MNKYLFGLFLLLMVSCSTEKTETRNELPVDEITSYEMIEDEVILIDKPWNVVTPEHWENFDTDIEMAILFYKGDSLLDSERIIVDGLKKEFSTLEFHEFYSDDKIAQVFINDTLAFDISNFIMEKSFGFVLLKPSVYPRYELLNDSLSTLKVNFHEFYGN